MTRGNLCSWPSWAFQGSSSGIQTHPGPRYDSASAAICSSLNPGWFQDWLGPFWEQQGVPDCPRYLRSISSDWSRDWSVDWIERPHFPRQGHRPFPCLCYPSLHICSSPARKIDTLSATPDWEWGWMEYGNHFQCVISKSWSFTVLVEPDTEARAPGFLK